MTDQIIYRSITPIFDFTISEPFLHTGSFRRATFSITLKHYPWNPEGFAELTDIADDVDREAIRKEAIKFSKHLMDDAEHYLVIDVTHPFDSDLEPCSFTPEAERIETHAHTTLSLHSTKSIRYHNTYRLRNPLSRGRSIVRPAAAQVLQKHLGSGPSELLVADFADCRKTFNWFLAENWGNSLAFERLLQLALEYHRTTFRLENVHHAFLILMIVFEALFKKETGGSIEAAAERIARLLSPTKADEAVIKSAFFSTSFDAFSKIRNKIAHGDPALDLDLVKAKYPNLYGYVVKAIVALISLPPGIIGDDYYDDLIRYIDSRFSSALPVSVA